MKQHDPVSDLLTRIRNSIRARHDKVDVPASRLKVAVAKVLRDEGYVRNIKLVEDRFSGILRIYLKYDASGDSVIVGIDRVSRPGCRIYRGKDDLPEVLGGLGISVVSTSAGLMTDGEARRRGIGGEVLCRVW